MKSGLIARGTIGLLALASVALAKAPPPRIGLQIDIRTGYSLPLGTAGDHVELSDVVSGQVPLIFDIGGKVLPELFVGGYLGFGLGAAGGAGKVECEANGLDCRVLELHIGVQAQYHILPAGPVNPWLGYGLGFESLGRTVSKDGATSSTSIGGFELARFMAGVDFRVTPLFGVGPFVDLSLASFSSVSNGGKINEKAMHEWLTLGARFVFFP